MGSRVKVNMLQHLSEVSKRRKPSPIRALQPLMQVPGMISLGAGVPNPQLFPFKGLSVTLKDETRLELTSDEITKCFQYSETPGLPRLLEHLRELQTVEHKPKYAEWSIATSSGSQDSLWKAFEMLLNPGDSIFVDDPTYSGALAFLKPFNCNLIGLPTDQDGISADALQMGIENALKTGKSVPRVLYTVPTGGNPSGCSTSLERKEAIYELCCQHDIIILEDDPYFFLNFGPETAEVTQNNFTRPKLRSYFSMDVQGRVIRFDSFSKVLSSGMRIGTVTGPSAFVDKINLHTQATSLHTSGVSQMLALKLLDHMGVDGFRQHADQVALFYLKRRDVFMNCANKHLEGLATWNNPTAGMFVWLKLLGVEDTTELILKKALDAKILLVPGGAFSPEPTETPKSAHVRAAYSSATDEEIDTALSRLAIMLESP